MSKPFPVYKKDFGNDDPGDIALAPSRYSHGATRLCAALLIQAISDAQGAGTSGTTRAQRIRFKREATNWFACNQYTIFSFLHVCDILLLEPEWTRQALLTVKRGKHKQHVATSGQARIYHV